MGDDKAVEELKTNIAKRADVPKLKRVLLSQLHKPFYFWVLSFIGRAFGNTSTIQRFFLTLYFDAKGLSNTGLETMKLTGLTLPRTTFRRLKDNFLAVYREDLRCVHVNLY